MKEIIITFNNKRKVVLLLIYSIFITLGVLMVLHADTFIRFWIISNPWVIKTVGLGAVVIFGVMLLLSSRVLFRKTALIIDDQGIIDNSSAGGEAGRIKWSEILDIRQNESNSATVILIFISDPLNFIEKKENAINKWSLKKNYKSYRTPVVIPLVLLNSYGDTLERKLKERWENYKKLGAELISKDGRSLR